MAGLLGRVGQHLIGPPYDALLSKVSKDSFTYALLKNGIVENQSNDANERRLIHILCESFEAEILLGIAKELWPDAALEIQNCIH
jgi:hypothetical protein